MARRNPASICLRPMPKRRAFTRPTGRPAVSSAPPEDSATDSTHAGAGRRDFPPSSHFPATSVFLCARLERYLHLAVQFSSAGDSIMGLLDGVLGGIVGAEMASVVNSLIQQHGVCRVLSPSSSSRGWEG